MKHRSTVKKNSVGRAGSRSVYSAIEDWFSIRGWKPFPFQQEVWDAFANGQSGLIHSATGTGKTYAAFLGPIIERLSDMKSNSDAATRPDPLTVLWITPLRALASDTAAALEAPVRHFNLTWEVGTRTGDTNSSVRARQRRRLPTVLVTTPESLTLFLTHANAPDQFRHLQLVVVDEWHELLSSKRGVQTELALARLKQWTQRLRIWGLSATLGNLDEALAALLGGSTGRIVRGLIPKQVQIDSLIPTTIDRFPWAGHMGLRLLPKVIEAIDDSDSTLVFTNTRAQAETWYQAIVNARPVWKQCIALHHGSLDRTARDEAENGLRDGTIRAVVCTSSLDLGVDFTPVDRVLQIGSPKGVARLLQRAGRSGHQPGAVSRLTFVPTNGLELIEVAAARAEAIAGNVEGRIPLEKPLDVLAQHVVTVALGSGFQAEELFNELRGTYSYRHLTKDEFQWVLDFVTHGGETLKRYSQYHRVELSDGVFQLKNQRLARQHRLSLGTIVSDAAMEVRYQNGRRLGTIEEAFVSRLKSGDGFTFAGKPLQLIRVQDMTAWVRRARRSNPRIPRWMGGRMPLSTELAACVQRKLEDAKNGVYQDKEMLAAKPILDLQQQWSRVPSQNEFLIESLESREGHHLFFYPFAGRLVHEGLAALLAWRMAKEQSITFTMAVNDYGFELLSATPVPSEQVTMREFLTTVHLDCDILGSLNATEMARRQFREIARVSGLIFEGYPGRAKNDRQLQASSGLLFDVFTNYDPNNLLVEQAMKEVLERQLEYRRLHSTLHSLQNRKVCLVSLKKPSPLAFPLIVERLRETVSSESLAERVERMSAKLEAGTDSHGMD